MNSSAQNNSFADTPSQSWSIISNAVKKSFLNVQQHNSIYAPRSPRFNTSFQDDGDYPISDSSNVSFVPTESPHTDKVSRKQKYSSSFGIPKAVKPDERWPLITIENDIDESIEPVIEYTNNLIFSKEFDLPLSRYDVCPCKAGSNYDEKQRLTTPGVDFISECGRWCGCPMECSNRVVQKERSIPLIVQRIKDYDEIRWAVKAQEFIHKGTFIDQYVGEIVTSREAMKRAMGYSEDEEVLVLEMFVGIKEEAPSYAIDAVTHGNVTRFFKHSNRPNTAIYPVFYESKHYHRMAFFSVQDIQPGDEITFNNWNLGT